MTNWLPSTCTGDRGVWCPASPTPSPVPGPSPRPTPSPSPTPHGPAKYVNYVIGEVPAASVGGTHLILSFMEPSTESIPLDGDNAWLKYTLGELSQMSASNRQARLKTLRQDGTKVMASLGGALGSHAIYSQYDPNAFGRRAAEYIIDLGLDGLDVDLEGWGNDPKAFDFLKSVTKSAFQTFKAAGGKKYVISHAPEMPYFWRGKAYAALLSDRESFDMIDFVNVQMYNQVPFPSEDHVFTKDVYDPATQSPTSLSTIADAIAAGSNGATSASEVKAKMLLGFPCKDGSFPVGSTNRNMCNQPQFDLVQHGISIGYPLAGVFEWSAKDLSDAEIRSWNAKMRKAMTSSDVLV